MSARESENCGLVGEYTVYAVFKYVIEGQQAVVSVLFDTGCGGVDLHCILLAA